MNKNRKPLVVASVIALLSLALASMGAAEEKSVKEGAKEVGRTIGSAVREVGQGAKQVGKAIGGAAKDGVEAAKEGGRELKKAVKGED